MELQTRFDGLPGCPMGTNTTQTMGALGAVSDSAGGQTPCALCHAEGRSSQSDGRSSDPPGIIFLKTSFGISSESMAFVGLDSS